MQTKQLKHNHYARIGSTTTVCCSVVIAGVLSQRNSRPLLLKLHAQHEQEVTQRVGRHFLAMRYSAPLFTSLQRALEYLVVGHTVLVAARHLVVGLCVQAQIRKAGDHHGYHNQNLLLSVTQSKVHIQVEVSWLKC